MVHGDRADDAILARLPAEQALWAAGRAFGREGVFRVGEILSVAFPCHPECNEGSLSIVKDNGVELTDSVHYITVELPKLSGNLTEVKDTPNWILFTIKNIGKMKEMPSEYKGSYLEKMFRLSNFASMDEMSQREYLARYMWEVDQRSQLRSARKEGLAEGHTEGLRETARRMLSKGIDITTISELTTLPSDEIRSL